MGDANSWISIVPALAVGGLVAIAVSWIAAGILTRRGFQLPDQTHRIGAIDGLRGYLALFVLISHYVQWTRVLALDLPWGTGSNQVMALGQVPVALFFMVTGVLFYPKARDGFGATRWRPFIVARLIRIYPLALLSIGIVLALLWIRSGFTLDRQTWEDTSRNLLDWLFFAGQPPLFGYVDSKLVNAGVFWSLTSEWVFYLAVLPAIAASRSLTRRWLPAWTTPLWALVAAIVLRIVWREQADYMLHFMLGMFIAQLRDHPRAAAFFRRPGTGAVSVLLMIAAITLLPPPIRDRTGLFYAPFLACIACGLSFGGLFASRASIALGEMSFGIYVLHGVVLWIGTGIAGEFISDEPALAAWIILPALAMLSVLVAAIAHVLIERPAILMGRRLIRGRRGMAPNRPALAGPRN